MRRFLSSFLALSVIAAVPSFAQKTLPPATPVPDPPGLCDGIAGNLVLNCSFETGDFTDWTTSNNLNATGVENAGFASYSANSGNFFLAMGNVGSDGVVSQTLSTTIGQTYTISFYYASNGTFSDFSALFNGNLLYAATNQNSGAAYNLYTFTDTATSTSTVLEFVERDDPNYGALDDVSVVPSGVPEPSSILLLGTAVGLCAFAFRKRAARNAAA